MPQKDVVINSRKFDGSIRRTWECRLLRRQDPLLEFLGVFDKEIVHPDLGIIRRGTLSYEYYWLDRWYNVFRFHEPEGPLRYFYCNINMPPVFTDGTLDYVDLDIDVLVSPEFETTILDVEDFEENAAIYGYSDEIRGKVNDTLSELMGLIEAREFPFNTTSPV